MQTISCCSRTKTCDLRHRAKRRRRTTIEAGMAVLALHRYLSYLIGDTTEQRDPYARYLLYLLTVLPSAHCNLSLDDICAVFLRTDQDSSISAGIESANAAATLRCSIFRLLGHSAKDCPHAEALKCFIWQLYRQAQV